MAEELVMNVKSNIKGVTKDTKKWGDSIKDVSNNLGFQKKILIEMEKELIDLQKAQTKLTPWQNSLSGTTKKIKKQKLEIKDQKNAIKMMSQEQKNSTAQTKKATVAQKDQNKETKEGIGSFTMFGVSLNGVKAAFGKIIPAAKAMFGSIKAGLISTGIGAFVILIASLFSYFKNTQRGAEMLERAMAGLGAVVDVVTDLFSSVGETIVNTYGVST